MLMQRCLQVEWRSDKAARYGMGNKKPMAFSDLLDALEGKGEELPVSPWPPTGDTLEPPPPGSQR